MRRFPPALSRGLAVASLLAGCARGPKPDAYGDFEATEVVVSAQTSGQIERFTPVEGMRLDQGAAVALIDTIPLALERRQLAAQRAAAGARRTEVAEQLRALEAQYEIARRAFERTSRLHAQQAATSAQLDQTEREYRSLGAQIEAVRAQRQSVGLDAAASDARVAQVRDRMARSAVTNPEGGTVLTTYARTGEVVQSGQPLYKIANLDTLVLRAYVTGGQLSSIRLGQAVEVSVDRGAKALVAFPGTISWISPTAEFTPTPIQTRDERADLVYAVKVLVPNRDGIIKIGMPGDVTFAARPAPSSPR